MLVSEFITNSYKLWLSTAQGVLAALYFNRHRTEWLLLFEANFSSFFIGREPTTWPANNCLQRMVCSCAMPSNSVWLQIIFCSCVKETVFFSFLRSLLRENGTDRFASQGYSLKKQTRWSNVKTIIELGYRKISWFGSVLQINYLPQPSTSANNWSCSPQTNHDILLNLSSNNC